jgi:AcrR family transcriptional regulator
MSTVSASELRHISAALLDQARAGTAAATITELARRSGLARPTLYRNHPDVVADFITQARQQQAAPRPPVPTQHLVERIARLRKENDDLRLHVEHYEEHIRRLTVENNRLRQNLAPPDNLANLDRRRRQHDLSP